MIENFKNSKENNEAIILNPSTDPLYSRHEAAEYLGVATQTLAIWASTKRYHLRMVKVGRLAKYRKSELDRFVNERTV
jgi:excisionase family DNA binding protein